MKRISMDAVRTHKIVNGIKIPASIAVLCPHCSTSTTMTTESILHDLHREAVSASCKCPGCTELCHFWILGVRKHGQNESIEIYMMPKPSRFMEQSDFGGDVPPPLMRAYTSAVDAFNSGNHTATAVCCRRTLEGIMKYRLPENQHKLNLYDAIEAVKRTSNFAAPLESLTHAIRNGGNLGAHFDMEKEASPEMAHAMVELLHYLISYLYVLPKEIENLDAVLNGSNNSSSKGND